MKICWILIIRIFHWILGINLKPNQTFDLIFRLNHGHNNQSPPRIQYLVFVFGFYSHATIVSGRQVPPPPPQFYLELKHTSPLVVTRYCNTVDGRQQARPGTLWSLRRDWLGHVFSRLYQTTQNRFCHLTSRPVMVWSKTAESLLQQNVWRCYRCSRWRRATFHVSPLGNSGPSVWTVP